MEERQHQRPRLPDQRREKHTFEMSAAPAPGREPVVVEAPAPAAPDEHNWIPATPDEIKNYDPALPEAASFTAANVVAAPAEPVKVTLPPTAGLDDLEEFILRTTNEGPQADKPARVRHPLSMVEKVCSGTGALILLALAIWLFRAVASEANGVPPASEPWPDLPLEGEMITLSEAATTWRARKDTDRVAQMEVILPVPGRQTPDYIPQVHFTLDAKESKSGYLRFIFRDSSGKPRGDTRVVQVEGGKLRSMDEGAVIKDEAAGAVYCSEGILSIHAYYSYTADDAPRWSVEVAESDSYSAGAKDWKVLGTFDVRNELAK